MFQTYAIKGLPLCISGKNSCLFVYDFTLDVHGFVSFGHLSCVLTWPISIMQLC